MTQTKPSGIMFHHFYDHKHPKGQGAISGDEFEAMLHYVGLKRIVPADEFQRRCAAGKLQASDVCITLDDSLRCQFDVAYPVLKKYGITAFWFLYTSPFEGILERLEVYRYYRTVAYPSVDDFYDHFFRSVADGEMREVVAEGLERFSSDTYLRDFPFYSDADKKFRFVRDQILKDNYFSVMDAMILEDKNFSPDSVRADLWMDEACVRMLRAAGHTIGLHSHTHPTKLAETSYENQQAEYARNHSIISSMAGAAPTAVSYPCNSYNDETLAIMNGLKITIGFTANTVADASNPLALPRHDHATIFKEMTL